jgi:psp operon transcriptional activator
MIEKQSSLQADHPPSAAAVTVEALGQSEAFLDFQERLSRVAPIDRSVLLVGERGTGKELAAARLHYLSGRWQDPFVSLNCAALVSTLIESELFGHEKGAFTGAQQRKTGRFEAADGGTLFLDEIGLIPIQAQEKVLRVVEYGYFERVGSSTSVEVDVRIIGATNLDLPALAEKGRFKKDLLDRLSFEVLFLPPLRERQGDILLLACHFAQRMAYELGRAETPEFSPTAVDLLENHRWEGNIRELKNAVERAVYRSDSFLIDAIALNPFRSPYEISSPPEDKAPAIEPPAAMAAPVANQPLKTAVRDLELDMLKRALEASKYNQKKAAGLLGLTYDQLRGLLRKYKEDL